MNVIKKKTNILKKKQFSLKIINYLLLLKQKNLFKKIFYLKYFLTQGGKIYSRIITQISIKKQQYIAKAIRKARQEKLLLFFYDINYKCFKK